MLKDNLLMLRTLHGLSQEEIAEKIGISRQAYAKWEKGITIPDIEKCVLLANLFEISLDNLVKTEYVDGVGNLPPAPKGKNIWGITTINDRGQIVIPKAARDSLALQNGTRLIVLSDEEGIALIAVEKFERNLKAIMDYATSEICE